MKSVKVVIATLIAVALMVTPIALYAVDDTPSDADTDFTELSQLMSNIDIGKLSELMMKEYNKTSTAADDPVTADRTVSLGEHLYMDKNFIFSDGKSITIESGASLTINPAQTFSLSSAGYGCLKLEQGSTVYLVTNGNAPSVLAGNIISSFPVTEDVNIYFTGKVAYTHNAMEFILSADKDTVIADSATPAQRELEIDFPSANNITFKISEAGTTVEKLSMEFTLTAALDVKMPIPVSDTDTTDAIIKGSADYTMKVVAPATELSSFKELDVSIKGNCDITVGISDYDETVKNTTDISIKTTNYKTKDAKTTLEGSLSLDVSTSNMEKYRPEGSDVEITVKNAKASYDLSLKNDTVTGEVDVSIGYYELTNLSDTGDDTMAMESVKLFGKYEGKYSPQSQLSSLSGLGTSIVSSSSPSSIATEYMKGIKSGMTESQVKAYASGFFLKKIDSAVGLDKAGVTGSYFKGEFDIGYLNYGSSTINGLQLRAEIAESVGFTAHASVDSIFAGADSPISKYVPATGYSNKLIVGTTSLDLSTSVDGKTMFDCEFRTSVEIRSYDPSGQIISNPYVKGVKGKMLIGTENSIVSLSISEIAFNSYGIYTKASNLNYDTVTKSFTVDEVKVGGNYYGLQPILSVDGTYKNCVIKPEGMALTTSVESVSLTVVSVNNDKMDFTRTYDSATNTITNTYNVDGQMYLAGIIDDQALSAVMFVPITGANNTTTETNVFKGGVLVPGGSVADGPSPVYMPSLIISEKDMTVNFLLDSLDAKAPEQVYVTTSSFWNYSYGEGAMLINGEMKTLSLTGVAVGVALDEQGTVSYSLMALPGYTLSTDMTYSGFTIDECNEKTAKISGIGTAISCAANPIKYKINVDGKTVKEDVEYGTLNVKIDGIAKDALCMVDNNGKIIGVVVDGEWTIPAYYYAKDLDVKSVTGKTILSSDVKKGEINKITDASSIKFTVPAGGSSLQFSLSSKVRFDLSGLTPDKDVELVAQATTFNGHDAFIIKATQNGVSHESTLYIPISKSNCRLMHVDEYGRASERLAEVVTIDGEYYLKTTASDYSIFYAETDDSPVIDDGGNGPNWLLYVAIGVVAVVVIAGVVIFVKKH